MIHELIYINNNTLKESQTDNSRQKVQKYRMKEKIYQSRSKCFCQALININTL